MSSSYTDRMMLTIKHQWVLDHVAHVGDECLIWPFSCCTPGYGQLMIKRKLWMAHRLMCALVHGDAPEGFQAAHSCGNRRCVNPGHLSWKTASENQMDRTVHGTHSRRGRRGKITSAMADQIRSLKGVETSVATAAKYGITESNVRLIQDGKLWIPGRRRQYLTDDEVREIRRLGPLMTRRELGRRFGRGELAVAAIAKGKSYRDVPDLPKRSSS